MFEKTFSAITAALLLSLNLMPLYAVYEEEGIEDILFSEIPVVSIAALFEERPEKASCNVSVVTANDIKFLGLKDLSDIYDLIPGFESGAHMSGGQYAVIRGLLSPNTPHLKIMVDGVHINDLSKGSTLWLTPGLSLDNVKQIEIIRGPGSALYGENALSGAMNIITKDANDIDGIHITGRVGSFKNKGGSILFGTKKNHLNIMASFDWLDTNGAKETIERDALFGSPITLAPGKTSYDKKRHQAVLKLSTKKMSFKISYDKNDIPPTVGGVGYAITKNNSIATDLLTTNIHLTHIGMNYKTKTTISYIDQHSHTKLTAFPPGYTIPFDLDGDGDVETFPEGVKGEPGFNNSRLSLSNLFTYIGLADHLIFLGVSYDYAKEYDVVQKANFHPLTNAQASDGVSIVDFTDTLNWSKNEDRSIWSVFAQDKIEIRHNLTFTIGGRYDNYQDTDSQVNPRASIVWSPYDKLTLRGMAGSAFRVPNYNEMYARNNPINIGNENLKSEKLKSYEIGGHLKLDNRNSYVNLNAYYNQFTNHITLRFNPGLGLSQYINSDSKQIFHGLESEFNLAVTDWAQWLLSYSYTYGQDNKTDLKIPGLSHHKIAAGLNLAYQDYLTLGIASLYYSKKERARKDTRDNISAYNLINTTLNFTKIQNMEFILSIHNLFNKSYVSPEPEGLIPHDIPRPGRSISFKTIIKF